MAAVASRGLLVAGCEGARGRKSRVLLFSVI
jgi:hypothetical protein